MATHENTFEHIGEVLQEINDLYLHLSDHSEKIEPKEIQLLQAQCNYLAAHVTLFQAKLVRNNFSEHASSSLSSENGFNQPIDKVDETKKVSFTEYFTPPSNLSDSHLDDPQKIQDAVVSTYHAELEAETVMPVVESVAEPLVEESHIELPQNESPQEVVDEVASEMSFVPVPEEEDTFVQEVIEEERQIVLENPVEVSHEDKPSRPLTLNEIISQQKQAGVQSRVYNVQQNNSSEKIKDVKSAVSLNDKLMFIKDLFNGYSLAYSEAIELVNRCSNFSEADAFLQTNYAVKNKWAEKGQSVEKLYEILRKRFG